MGSRPRRGAIAWLLAALALSAAALADTRESRDPYLGQLAGQWDMLATVPGKPAWHQHGEGRWVLEHGWLLLHIIDLGHPPAYEASVYLGLDRKAGDYIAHWLDRFGAAGARVVGSGRREGQKLVLLFPYAEGAFRDTLVVAADGNSATLLLESQEKDGSWSTFASYRMTRMPQSPAAPPGGASRGP